MRILVMGGTRFFGKLLVEKLIKEGNDVTILTKGTTKDTFQGEVERIIALRSDKKQMEAVLKNRCFEVVYDQLCFSPDDAAIACNLLKGRITKYIFASSMFVYAASKNILREEDFNPYLLDIKMGDRKVLSYDEGKRYAEVFFLKNRLFPVISVRLPIIMGSNDYTGRFIFHIKRILSGEDNFIPDNPGKMNYINAKGAADFLFWLKSIDFEGPINAASPESFDVNELVELFAKVLKKKPRIVREDINQMKSISPYYRKGNMTLSITRAENLGYKFPSFFSWFADEVMAAYSDLNRENSGI